MQKNSTVKTLQIIVGALIAGQSAYLLISLYLGPLVPEIQNSRNLNHIALLVVMMLTTSGIAGNRLLSRARLEQLKSIPAPAEKIAAYRSLVIVRSAMLEVPAFIAITGVLLLGNPILILLALMSISVFVFTFPTMVKVAAELGISDAAFKDLQEY